MPLPSGFGDMPPFRGAFFKVASKGYLKDYAEKSVPEVYKALEEYIGFLQHEENPQFLGQQHPAWGVVGGGNGREKKAGNGGE